MKKILLITLVEASFVKLDEKILEDKFQLTVFRFRHRKGWRVISELIREFLFVLLNIWKSDLIYIWFADFHSVIPSLTGRILGKKVVIVVGGYDAADRKDLNYGVKIKPIGRFSSSVSLRLATHLLPVTRFTMEDLLENFGKRLEKKCRIIYNSYNQNFHCKGDIERSETIVTICLAHSKITVIRKGVDFFLEIADKMPDKDFIVVGLTDEAMAFSKSICPRNVTLLGKITQEELKEILCSSKVICQFSRYEAFGVALLEGIAAGCYPVGYDYGGTREILTDGHGILIEKLSVEEGVVAIKKALEVPDHEMEPLKNAVLGKFPTTKREHELVSFIKHL